MEIKNKQVKELFERWKKVFYNQELSEDARIRGYTSMELIEALVSIYEKDIELDEEEMDDLFIRYGDGIKPIFPEQREELLKHLKNQKES